MVVEHRALERKFYSMAVENMTTEGMIFGLKLFQEENLWPKWDRIPAAIASAKNEPEFLRGLALACEMRFNRRMAKYDDPDWYTVPSPQPPNQSTN